MACFRENRDNCEEYLPKSKFATKRNPLQLIAATDTFFRFKPLSR